jgi:hypothetical protein
MSPHLTSQAILWGRGSYKITLPFFYDNVREDLEKGGMLSEEDNQTVTEINVDSFEEFHNHVQDVLPFGVIFRGMRDISWDLTPSFGRHWRAAQDLGMSKADFLNVEGDMIRLFRKESARYLGFMPKDVWEVWSMAQHHGLPTRLLDWTFNPLVGLFFAVEKPFDGDSVVYALHMPDKYLSIKEEETLHPLSVTEVRTYEPSHQTHRVNAQSAIFAVQPDPTEPLSHPNLHRIRIRNNTRQQMRRTLFKYGVTRKLLFPGLDGIADWLKQMRFEW